MQLGYFHYYQFIPKFYLVCNYLQCSVNDDAYVQCLADKVTYYSVFAIFT